jgi:SAM-dependent methyltransferase
VVVVYISIINLDKVMHYSAYSNAEKFYHNYCEKNIENKKILDVGSYDVNGTMKPIFEKGDYVGLDMEAGPNVDVVGVSHDIPFEKDEFDIVISSSCFEHDDMFWISFQEMCRVLKPGGYMYIQAPSNGPYHGWPGDNWRFYIDSWKALEKWGKRLGYNIELVEHYIDTVTPPSQSEGNRIWNDSIGIFRKKNKYENKVALISTFCDTQEKIDVLEKNIKLVKEQGLDVIAISPIPLPQSVTSLCDYFFFTKDNPVLDWPKRAMRAWVYVNINGETRKVSRTYPDYGFAGLTQVKQLSDIALSFGYDQFYHMIYDLKIDENVIEGFHSSKECNIYPSKRGKIIWEVGLHYMIFNRENLKEFISKISLENYLNLKDSDAFEWLRNLKESVKYEVETIPVEDEIYYYENIDFFNYSPTDKFKFFIEKNDELVTSIKLLFYEMNGEKEIKVKVGDSGDNVIVTKNQIIDLGFNRTNYQKVVLEIDSEEYDITEIIKGVKHNIIV